ncbi:ABC transporter substrate-binding protein [Catenulispora pinisilvae]|uniref:ABC transporter substrate-binding protein n=1 Tax=Catenulispora pinisilvae TaxID=2705253 RepID=UPI00189145AC|nr:sugar ABC transporter substrate-binding protein [Catenulispora pinisilvae]
MSMRTSRRSVLRAGIGALAVAVTGGCATGGGAKKPAKSLNAQAQVTGSITVWSWDVAAKALKRLAPAFEQQHPGVKVNVVDIGYDNAYDKITIGLKSGAGLPDVLQVEGQKMQSYIGTFPSGFYDLSTLAGPLKSQFNAAAWATGTDAGGKVYALPWDIGPCGVFCRTDIFQQAGVDPGSIQTWDDYIAAGVQIKARTGKKLLVVDPTGDSTFPMLLQQEGQGYFVDGKIAVSTPAAVKAMTVMKELNDKGLVDYEKGWDALVSSNKDGNVATAPTAVWWSGTLTDEMPELKGKFSVIPLPAFTSGGVRTSNNGGSLLNISSQSKNSATAWAFIQFVLANSDNQVSMLKNEGIFPAFVPALSDPYITGPQDYYGGQTTFKTFADLAKDIAPVEYTGDYSKASDLVTTATSAVMQGGKDPKSTLDSTAQQIAAATNRQIAQ